MVPENFKTLNDIESFVFGKLGKADGEAQHSTQGLPAALRLQIENALPSLCDDDRKPLARSQGLMWTISPS